MRFQTFSLFLVSFCFSSFALAGQKVKNCSSAAESQVEESLRFVKNNLTTIIQDTGDLTQNEKDKLRRKIDSVDLKCMDHKPVCQNHDDRAGVSRHIFESAVVLCYNTIREFYGSNAACELADTIIHEIGHTADVHHGPNHNDGPNNDRVYRLGNAAASLCYQMGRAGTIPRNTNDD